MNRKNEDGEEETGGVIVLGMETWIFGRRLSRRQ